MPHQLARRSLAAVIPLLAATALPALDTVTVSTAGNTAYEQGSQPATFLLTRTGSSGPLTVTYALSGTATNTTDFTTLSLSATFASGSTTTTVTITPVDDTLPEGSETVTLSLTNGGGSSYIVGSTNAATITIGDSDIQGRMSSPDPSADEFPVTAGFSPIELLQVGLLHFKLNQPSGSGSGTEFRSLPRTNSFQIGGTATLGTDYKLLIDASIGATLTAGVSAGAATLTISNGSDLSTYLSSGSYVSVTGVRGFYPVSGTPTGTTTLTVNLGGSGLATSANAGAQVKRIYRASTSAAAASDATAITYGSSDVNFRIDDYVVFNNRRGVYKITAVTPTELTISPGLLEPVGNGTLLFRVGEDCGLTGGSGSTLIYSRYDVPDSSGAVPALGYRSDIDFIVLPLEDSNIEGRETVTITTLTSPDYNLVTPTVATVTISDADVVANIAFVSNGGEPSTAGTMRVTLSSALPQAIDVPIQVVGGIGTTTAGVATLDTDYTITGVDNTNGIGVVTIPAGATSALITVSPKNDSIVETNGETVTVSVLQSPDYLLASTGTSYSNPNATINIADKIGTVDVTIDATSNLAREGASSVTLRNPSIIFTLRDNAGNVLTPAQALGVSYSVSGTAINGQDYDTLSGNVIIPTSGAVSLPITIRDDLMVEPSESIIITLVGGAGYDVASTSGTVTLNITDDEPVVSIVAGTSPVEGGVSGNFTVSYAGMPAGTALNRAVVVNYSVATSSTATAGTDYSSLDGTVTIPPNALSAPISVVPIDDAQFDPGETITLTLNDGGLAYSQNSASSSASLTITDNEPTITVAVTTSGAEPSTTGVFTITASSPVAGTTLNIPYTITGTATSADHGAVSGTATIAVSGTTTTVSVPVIDDAFVDPGETVILTLTGLTGADTSATMTLTDDEPASISFAAATATVAEGSTLTVSLIRTGGISGPASVAVSASTGTATSGSDYTAVTAQTVSWANGEGGTKTLIFTALGDSTTEPDETAVLTMGTLTGASAGTTTTMTITITDIGGGSTSGAQQQVAGVSAGGCGAGLGAAGLIGIGFLVSLRRRRHGAH